MGIITGRIVGWGNLPNPKPPRLQLRYENTPPSNPADVTLDFDSEGNFQGNVAAPPPPNRWHYIKLGGGGALAITPNPLYVGAAAQVICVSGSWTPVTQPSTTGHITGVVINWDNLSDPKPPKLQFRYLDTPDNQPADEKLDLDEDTGEFGGPIPAGNYKLKLGAGGAKADGPYPLFVCPSPLGQCICVTGPWC